MAQIEIMSLDLPRVEYLNDHKDSKAKTNRRVKATDDVTRLQEQANERARLKRANKDSEWTQMKLSDLPANTQDNTNTHG